MEGSKEGDKMTLDQTFQPPVDEWLVKFNQGILTETDIRTYWARTVPSIYSPSRDCNCLNIQFDEENAKSTLLLPLEQFLTLSDKPKEVCESLKKTDADPMLCGKMFKSGEPVYSCRDCGLDASCVLCVDCFKRSSHRSHKYKMCMSSGGGYCDCGDAEAWRAHVFCDLHLKGSQKADPNEDPRTRLASDLVNRTEIIMKTVVHYCFEILEWNNPLALPESLNINSSLIDPESADYVTMLFNDEIHTYDQVIQTLGRAIECTTKEAIDFATTVDHEGRTIVRCSSFQPCSQVKQLIEKFTGRSGSKPLRCDVMLTSVIAHQTFAMRLLTWLQNILQYCEGFRSIFGSIMMKIYPVDDTNRTILLESIMKADVRLWKTARNQWHQLFIIGLLMNSETKKQFAKTFTRIYSTLMKDFINDDHEHGVSIASLAVQIFTVPTLAYNLIAEDDAFNILISTFLNECIKHRNNEGKLAFERNNATIQSFKRVQFILCDLKYLLYIKPKVWTDELRKSFLHGFHKLIELLGWMQGMDSVIRQIGAHVEFEAEWETGINLQLKLAPILSLIIDWCGSDSNVLVKALRISVQDLSDRMSFITYDEWSLCSHRVKCIQYDVSTSPVTIHIPLSRLVAGLLLHVTTKDLNPKEIIRPSARVLMELPLRTLVLIAQFRAGMWRRNGYSLVNQVYFYHNTRLRDEMYDRDIMMLQFAAASMDPNEFLILVLNKFGLIFWAQDSFESKSRKPEEDFMRQTVTMVEEFLNLLLIIVSERYTPGIGNVTFQERMRREIIHWLCMEPMTHSDLLKCLPRELCDEVEIEKLILDVANFKRPSPNQAGGKYELKEEFYANFNPFFYHYSRQEQSTAEEVQLKRKRTNREKLICCPPPVPPEFAPYYTPILKILTSDIFLYIINSVLLRATITYSLSFSETQFEKILHLVGVALHEESKSLQEQQSTSSGEREAQVRFTELAVSKCLLSLFEACLDVPRIGSHRDLLLWTLKKFSDVAKLRGTELPSTMISAVSEMEDEKPLSKETSKAKIAAQRRARIMAQMQDMQKNFIKGHAEYFKDKDSSCTSGGSLMDLTNTEDESREEQPKQPCAVGINQRGKEIPEESHICILCREEQAIELSGRCMVLAAFVQGSTVLSKNRERSVQEDSFQLFMPSDLYFGCHVSTCGHVMHSDCWQKFFDAVLSKERRRPLRYGRHVSFDVDKSEFLCPLCECLSNAVIPLIPPSIYRDSDSESFIRDVNFSEWITSLLGTIEKISLIKLSSGSTEDCSIPISGLIPRIGDGGYVATITTAFIEISRKLSDDIKAMMRLLNQSIFHIFPHRSDFIQEDMSLPTHAYWAAAFTIHSIERVLRDEKKSIFGDLSSRRYNCLQALVRYVGVITVEDDYGFIRLHCARLLKYLLVYEDYILGPSCLDVDAFGLLLTLILTSPSLHLPEDIVYTTPSVPNGSVSDQHFINLMTVFHCVQIILSNKDFVEDYCSSSTSDSCSSSSSNQMDIDDSKDTESESESLFIHEFYTSILVSAVIDLEKGEKLKEYNKNRADRLIKMLRAQLLPFLRCTAVFFHFLTGVVPPAKLKEGGGQSLPSSDVEFTLLCEYLGLSSKFSILIGCQSLRQLARLWCQHPRVRVLVCERPENSLLPPNLPLKLIKQPHSVNQLLDLPKDYSELINSVSQFTCPNSESDEARTPTMCLVCGTILCSQSYCCQTEIDGTMVGACTFHAHDCGAGIGIFLRIRDCKIVLLAGRAKGCYMSPPYIDEYGETDQGLFRGNPLSLCESSYKQLHRLWLRHGIPEEIAHSLELHSNMATINWTLL
ncbi:E3 ubiquitin-protein ligase UBR2-like isoform X2 [Panonychus citri]|uniref:E3 ubiquitin-protein ligase UBR2-like isoform X2 n=1 Tax=Panonychus citri TaxID=50023 RepID=UPI002307F4D5|nr:E3 ubiquitin-protein ligase UBR2-like isoform X2 [Panonychus citri]